MGLVSQPLCRLSHANGTRCDDICIQRNPNPYPTKSFTSKYDNTCAPLWAITHANKVTKQCKHSKAHQTMASGPNDWISKALVPERIGIRLGIHIDPKGFYQLEPWIPILLSFQYGNESQTRAFAMPIPLERWLDARHLEHKFLQDGYIVSHDWWARMFGN